MKVGETTTAAGGAYKWICGGLALRMDTCSSSGSVAPTTLDNLEVFQSAWRRHLPVVVGDMTRKMDVSLWSPTALQEQFGEVQMLLFI